MTEDGIKLTEQQHRKRRGRSIAIAATLFFLVAAFYAITIVRLGPGVLDRAL